MKMYTFATGAVVPRALALVRPALTTLAEGVPDKRTLWARQPPLVRRHFGHPYGLGAPDITPEYLDEVASKLTRAHFTVTLPDHIIWTSRRNEIFAWVTAEWARLGLEGAPPPEMIRAASWRRQVLTRSRYRAHDLPATVILEGLTGLGYTSGVVAVRNALALPRKDFN